MDRDARRSLHELILRALEKDPTAVPAIEAMIFGFDRSGSAADVAQALEMLDIVGGSELHDRVAALLQANDEIVSRQQWPLLFP